LFDNIVILSTSEPLMWKGKKSQLAMNAAGQLDIPLYLKNSKLEGGGSFKGLAGLSLRLKCVVLATVCPNVVELEKFVKADDSLLEFRLPGSRLTLFEACVRKGNMDSSKMLLKYMKNKNAHYPMHWAAWANKTLGMQWLRENGFSLDQAAGAGASVEEGMRPIEMAILCAQFSSSSFLVKAGVTFEADKLSNWAKLSNFRQMGDLKRMIKKTDEGLVECSQCWKKKPQKEFESLGVVSKKSQAPCKACAKLLASKMAHYTPPPHVMGADIKSGQANCQGPRGAIFKLLQGGVFDAWIGGKKVDAGTYMSEKMDGQPARIVAGSSSIDFRFHGVLSIMIELCAFTFLPDGLKYREGGWLYAFTMSGIDCECALVLSSAIWKKHFDATSGEKLFPFRPDYLFEETFFAKELERLYNSMMSKPGDFRSRSLALCDLMHKNVRPKGMSKNLPDFMACEQASRTPMWWNLVSSMWGAAWELENPPCMFFAVPFGCANGSACKFEHSDTIKALSYDIGKHARLCSVCKEFAMSKCCDIYYCGPNCQKKDWTRHKSVCARRGTGRKEEGTKKKEEEEGTKKEEGKKKKQEEEEEEIKFVV
jgi:hypothetical protein